MTLDEKSHENDNSDTIKHTEGSNAGKRKRSLTLSIFHLIERIILIIVVVMTLGAVAFEIHTIYVAQIISLADILLMFLYLEVIGMVSVFYSDPSSAEG